MTSDFSQVGILRKVSDFYQSRNSWRAGKGRAIKKGPLENTKAGEGPLEGKSQET